MGIKDFYNGIRQLLSTALEEGVYIDELYGVLVVVCKQAEVALDLELLKQHKENENVLD